MTDPHGRGPRPPSLARWVTVGVPVALAALIAVGVAAYVAVADRESAAARPSTSLVVGGPVPSSELEGEWSGEGSLTDCAGYDDDGCPRTRSITLSIDCSGPCAVVPFERAYGRPPLTFEDGGYRAAGPVPPKLAPVCDGGPASSALWKLEFVPADGRLRGSYAETTVQGFDCPATWARWEVTFDRG